MWSLKLEFFFSFRNIKWQCFPLSLSLFLPSCCLPSAPAWIKWKWQRHLQIKWGFSVKWQVKFPWHKWGRLSYDSAFSCRMLSVILEKATWPTHPDICLFLWGRIPNFWHILLFCAADLNQAVQLSWNEPWTWQVGQISHWTTVIILETRTNNDNCSSGC